MNCLVVLVAGLILSASPGNTLQCYSCLASTERCVGDTVNCPAGERCFLSVAEAVGVRAYRAGCLPPAACNFQPNITGVSLSVSCCNTDLCNESDQVKLSLLLFPALVSVWFAIFM
ncbi:CD59 glycoprotein-like isoform X2 [Amblyraja radiata]|uniref:CD59 glycoprotein-like isoform X2 n=1 Tax=Amblyraja radiata TaxID=386614 RepID=UPI001403D51C|nr:CD59 glycoprotein-like isoform X2 [Amblyraja radiata]